MPAGSVDLGDDVMVSLSDQDRRALASMAADGGMTPAEWLASLALALLRGRGRCNRQETPHLADVASALRQITARMDMQPADSMKVLRSLYTG